MINKYPWIFIDNGIVYKFYLNSDNQLVYTIASKGGKLSKENIIDREVLEFSMCVEEKTIHIVYFNKKNQLKYCMKKSDNWFGENLYDINLQQFEVKDLNVVISEGKMHIFYLIASIDGSRRGIIKHCIWNGRETKLNTLQHIVLSDEVKICYEIEAMHKNNIYVFFVSDRGDEITLSYCRYANGLWHEAKRLYGIQGGNIAFKVISVPYSFNILNKIQEGKIYTLNIVNVQQNVEMKEYEIYKDFEEPMEPILKCIHDRLLIFWLKGNSVFYSEYDFGNWKTPAKFNIDTEKTVRPYNYLDKYGNKSIIYAIDDEKLFIYDFDRIILDKKNKSNSKSTGISEDESIEEIKEKLKSICYENSILKEKIDSFSVNMKKKKFIVQEYENKINRINEEKNRLKDNCNFFMEFKQNIQKKLDYANEQLKNKNITINKMKNNMTKIEEKIDYLLDENNRLKTELEIEKNKSIMEKLFRKKE